MIFGVRHWAELPSRLEFDTVARLSGQVVDLAKP